ncbi:unnamed protein product [Rotaria sordida]|nr:unnamed protein product [Rotaria sordida]
MIYVCTMMWHETTSEMVRLLKSIFRLDSDQHIRSVHGVEKIVEDTMKIPTSYGERLVWLLPGKNRLILHMKHKNR